MKAQKIATIKITKAHSIIYEDKIGQVVYTFKDKKKADSFYKKMLEINKKYEKKELKNT